MIRPIAVLAFAAVLAFSCSGNDPEPENTDSEFTSTVGIQDMIVPPEGDTFTVSITATGAWKCAVPQTWIKVSPAEGKAGSFEVEIKVEANTATSGRMTTLTFRAGDDVRSMLISQDGKNPDAVTAKDFYLNSHYHDKMHFSTGRLRTTSAVMQSFDISKDGNTIYYTQLNNNFRVYLSWAAPNYKSTPANFMTLNYTGHGSNFTIEEASDGVWIWMDNFSSKNSSGEYWDAQIISRFPVKAGTTINSFDATENYYFGEKNISVAVDIEGDMLTILGISSGRIRTYRLSELKALPVEDITLAPITYGGEQSAPHSETTKTLTVKARDARKLTTLGDFSITRGKYSDGTTISWQGFDVHGGMIYQAQGNGHADGTPSPGWVQMKTISGTTIVPLTTIKALEDLNDLKEAGITDTGYMEPEGVKWRNGLIYCGFASKNSSNVRMGTIFNYNPNLMK